MLAKVAGPFDLIFQDGDKKLYTPLLERLVSLLRPGGLLITDNVLWDGEVVPGFKKAPERDAGDTRAIAEYNERLSVHPELMTATVPLRDGIAIAVKLGSSELKPMLDALARATRMLREADFNDDAHR
jgi:predicted O-methyltransferase YrrM